MWAGARELAPQTSGTVLPQEVQASSLGIRHLPLCPSAAFVDPKDVSFTDLNIRLLPGCDLHGYEERGDRHASPATERHGGR